MFRSDRDALADKVDDLQAENERLRRENEAMRSEIIAHVSSPHGVRPSGSIYASGAVAGLTEGERAALQQHTLKRFPAWLVGVLSVLTLGIFPLVHFGLMHDRLPRADSGDPSAGKAIAFWFIPCFNLYWLFFAPLRLVDRLNLQLALRGQPRGIPRGVVVIAGVLSLIPGINRFVAPIAWLAAAVWMQMAVNRLVDLSAESARPLADARAAEPAPGVRIPRVADLPGPDDVAREEQAEAEADAAEASAPPRTVGQ